MKKGDLKNENIFCLPSGQLLKFFQRTYFRASLPALAENYGVLGIFGLRYLKNV